MELSELDLGADIDARLQRWQVRRPPGWSAHGGLVVAVARGIKYTRGYVVRAVI